MIQTTKEEKEALKRAKKEAKSSYKAETLKNLEVGRDIAKKIDSMILKGILDTEHILPDDYPVYYDYVYVVDKEGTTVVLCEIDGNVAKLKQALRSRGMVFENVYNCDIFKRNIL